VINWHLGLNERVGVADYGVGDWGPSTSSNNLLIFQFILEPPHKVYNGQLYLVLYSIQL